MSNKYKTIIHRAEGIFKERGSKFIAFVFPCSTVEDFEANMLDIKKLHPKSKHYCYAYRLLEEERLTDDGEPSGTAGKPIMGQLIKEDLKEVGAIVIRYFGGTLLGTGGLIQAYKLSTALAIETASIITKEIKRDITLEFEYNHLSAVMQSIKRHNYEVSEQKLVNKASITLTVNPDHVDQIIQQLMADIGGLYLSDINEHTSLPGLRITRP